ncbi:hypothetical protein [Clostridium sp.]|uniref:hypothetical protein n=1 Tax=Clostridium sp. TaxID=1506 RepID=UPI00345D94FB
MKKIYAKRQIYEIDRYPIEFINNIVASVEVLNMNYGYERDVDNELGGYVLIAESIVDIEILKQNKLQGLVPEYIDIIECS